MRPPRILVEADLHPAVTVRIYVPSVSQPGLLLGSGTFQAHELPQLSEKPAGVGLGHSRHPSHEE